MRIPLRISRNSLINSEHLPVLSIKVKLETTTFCQIGEAGIDILGPLAGFYCIFVRKKKYLRWYDWCTKQTKEMLFPVTQCLSIDICALTGGNTFFSAMACSSTQYWLVMEIKCCGLCKTIKKEPYLLRIIH